LKQIQTQKILMMYTMSCGQFAGDRGKKEASKEVGERERERGFTC
jgi:hypothetical protein